jgi:hypothetical protein
MIGSCLHNSLPNFDYESLLKTGHTSLWTHPRDLDSDESGLEGDTGNSKISGKTEFVTLPEPDGKPPRKLDIESDDATLDSDGGRTDALAKVKEEILQVEKNERKIAAPESWYDRHIRGPEVLAVALVYRDGRPVDYVVKSEPVKVETKVAPKKWMRSTDIEETKKAIEKESEGKKKKFAKAEEELQRSDVVGSMLTALSGFVKEAYSMGDEASEEFKELKTSTSQIVRVQGKYADLLVRYKHRNETIGGLEAVMIDALEEIEKNYSPDLIDWDGNSSRFTGIVDPALANIEKLLYKNQVRKWGKRALAVFAALLLPTLGYLALYKPPAKPPVQHAPELAYIQDINITAGEPLKINLAGFDADNNSLEYNIVFLKNGTALPVDKVTGKLYLPAVPSAWLGTNILNASIKEKTKYGLSAFRHFNLTVLPRVVNHPPEITGASLEKTGLYTYLLRANASDIDGKVGGIEVSKNGKKFATNNSDNLELKLDLSNLVLDPQNKFDIWAWDAFNASLHSNSTTLWLNLTSVPEIKLNKTSQKNDTINFAVDYFDFADHVHQLEVGVKDTGIKTIIPINKKMGTVSGSLNLTELFGTHTLKFKATDDADLASNVIEKNVTLQNDPSVLKVEYKAEGGDIWNYTINVTDVDTKITDVALNVNTPTPITREDTPNSQQVLIKGKMDLSETLPGDYITKVTAKDNASAEQTNEATVKVLNDRATVIYNITPDQPSNDFDLTFSIYDKDTKIARFDMVVEREDRNQTLYDHNLTDINNKLLISRGQFNYSIEEPGPIKFVASVTDQLGENYPLFEEHRFILNDAPTVADSVDSYYNPLNKTIPIWASASDVDSHNISSGDYELTHTLTKEVVKGKFSAKDGAFDSKLEDMIAEIDMSGRPEGIWLLNVTATDSNGGVSQAVTKTINVQNQFDIVSMLHPNPDADKPVIYWDRQASVAKLLVKGNNSYEYEKVNDFYKFVNGSIKNELQKNYTKYVNYTDPLQTMTNLLPLIATDPNSMGVGDSYVKNFVTQHRAAMEWIRYQILANNSVNQSTKDLWKTRFFISPVNYNNLNYPINFAIYDQNRDGIIQDTEEWTYGQNCGPFAHSTLPTERLIIARDLFAAKYGEPAAQQRAKETILDYSDLEWRFLGLNFTDIFNFINPDVNASRALMTNIDNYGLGQPRADNNLVGNTIQSTYSLKDSVLGLQGKTLNVGYDTTTKQYKFRAV